MSFLTRTRIKVFVISICLAASVGGCMPELPVSAFAGATPEMRPERFFAGATRSSGVLQTGAGAPVRRLRVEGLGNILPDGSLHLVQRVTFDQDTPTTRVWVIRRLDEHRYSATLSDASGLVRGEAYGNVFHLRYAMKTPFGGVMEQWLYLQSDGRTLLNEATISILGLTVARVSERISQQSAEANAGGITPPETLAREPANGPALPPEAHDPVRETTPDRSHGSSSCSPARC